MSSTGVNYLASQTFSRENSFTTISTREQWLRRIHSSVLRHQSFNDQVCDMPKSTEAIYSGTIQATSHDFICVPEKREWLT
jgi:hypothetical protein